jgi:D-glycero-alpha-D-manno-heptose-7-phosphate kinase
MGQSSMVNSRTPNSPGLIVTRTPLRVSFAGGGTDLAAFYQREYGAVLSTAINQYIYVMVKRHGEVFNEPIRLNYSKSERVDRVDEIENNIARECLRLLKIEPPIYISTVGDLPASTGLGSSSAFAVGLLNALHAFRGERVSAGQLAEEAATIEIEVLKQPIGKQDQYAAAFGGFNFLRFNPGDGVTVEPVRACNGTLGKLFGQLLMFWTGHQRSASTVLTEVRANVDARYDYLLQMRQHAHQLHELISEGRCEAPLVGEILDETWRLKRQLAHNVSNRSIDDWYDRARAAGAAGGKLCGAGSGGFLLFAVSPNRQASVGRALSELTQVPIQYEAHGSRVLMPNGH